MFQNIQQRNKYKYWSFSFIFTFLLANIILDFPFDKANMIIVLLSCLVLVYKSRLEIGSSIVFLFLLFSMIQISPEYLFNVRTTAYVFYYREEYYSIVVTILMFFLSTLAIFYNERKGCELKLGCSKNNKYIFSILVMILVFILIFGVSRRTSSSYTVSITTIYEYFIMVMCLAYYYSSKSKFSNTILLTLSFIYILQDFYYGGRISSVQLVILCTILFFQKVKFKRLVQLMIPGYVLLSIVEIYRVNYSLKDISFTRVLNQLTNNPLENYKWNTFSEVLYSSSGLVYVKEMVYSFFDRFRSLLDFVVNIIIGGVRPFGNIVTYISNNVSPVGGGGFFPVYLYFWLDWIGVILFTFLVVRFFNFEPDTSQSDFRMIMYIITLSMFPRWFYYSPLILFRYVVLNLFVLYALLVVFDYLLRKFMKSL